MQGSSYTAASIPGTPSTSGTTPGGGYITTTTPSSSQQTSLTINQGAGGVSWNTLSGFTPAIGFLNADGAHAVLSFLNATYDAQIVSTPRIVTLDNEMATIEVTRGYPIINMSWRNCKQLRQFVDHLFQRRNHPAGDAAYFRQ